jgi:PQQ-dependent catabolism-associated CXXCW motif protein
MIKRAFRLLAAVFMLYCGLMDVAFAQTSIDQLKVELLSPWVVTVEGEARLRSLRLTALAGKDKDLFLIEANYGWLDGQQDPALAELKQTGTERKLTITTGAQSTIVVSQSPDGSLNGVFKPKAGSNKTVRLEKIPEQDLQVKVQAALTAKASQDFANEGKDWGVAPTTTARRSSSGYHAATPLTIPGAKVIKTGALKALLDMDKSVVVVDVLDGKDRVSIPGAYWMQGGGEGVLYGAEKSRFAAALEKLTAGDKSRSLVFLCLSSECWLSYNAALHALEAGYSNVTWYRGGINSWKAARLPLNAVERFSWSPAAGR